MTTQNASDARLAVLALIDRCMSALPRDRADWDMHDRRVASTCDKATAGDREAVDELRYLEDFGIMRP